MREKAYLLYVGLALAVVVLLNLPAPGAYRIKAGARDGIAPFQNVLSWAVGSIGDFSRFARGSVSFAREKRQLEEEIANLRLDVQSLRGLETENAELRSLLGFSARHRYRLLLCDVVARGDAGGWWETVRLSRGAAAGLRSDMAVITTQGLVGKTTHVSEQTADVLLLTDPNCKIACKLRGSDSFGIVRGTGASLGGARELSMLYTVPSCRMEFLHRDAEVVAGTEVVTSEISGIYPEGLPVGTILRSELDSSLLFRRAEVAPAAEMGRLRHVFVVLSDRKEPAAEGADPGPVEGLPAPADEGSVP